MAHLPQLARVFSVCFLRREGPRRKQKKPISHSGVKSRFCLREVLTSKAPDCQYNGRHFKDLGKTLVSQVVQLPGGLPFEMPVIVLTVFAATLKANGLFLFPSGAVIPESFEGSTLLRCKLLWRLHHACEC